MAARDVAAGDTTRVRPGTWPRGTWPSPVLAAGDRLGRRLGEERHAELHPRGAVVLLAELAADVPAVDRLAEHSGLPQRERLEPRERLDAAAAALGVALDEVRLRREAGLGRHRRRAEGIRRASR